MTKESDLEKAGVVKEWAKARDGEVIRKFNTGATRDAEDGKLDYEGFLSPLALERYAEYMHKHRLQSNGEMRDSDNWQKGIPVTAYMKSMWRHFMDVWSIHRMNDLPCTSTSLEESLCAVLFNAFGYLHELRREWEDATTGRNIIERQTEVDDNTTWTWDQKNGWKVLSGPSDDVPSHLEHLQ